MVPHFVEDRPAHLLDQAVPAVGLGLVLLFEDRHPLGQPLAGLEGGRPLVEPEKSLARSLLDHELKILQVGIESGGNGGDRRFDGLLEALHADPHRSLMLMGAMAELGNVLVIGGGTMGSQIALQTALGGRHEVYLVDTSEAQLEKAVESNRKIVGRGIDKGRYTQQQGAAALEAISIGTDIVAAASGADLVIEAVFEDFEVKADIFKRVDAAAPEHAILASNSSSIVISRLAAVTRRPDRCCNLHFFHPVTVMPLCEVVQGPLTSDSTIATAMDFVRSIDRIPVHIRREIHGFIVNRILVEAIEEALRLLEGGFASQEDIDTAVKKGLNWPMGPFELLDFSGIDIFYGVLEDRHRQGEGPEPSRILREKVEAGQLGRKSGKGFYDYAGGD